ncbi:MULTISPECIES: ABC transporter permease [unclassified Leifsonia]|uniref:ABC transporter permease n=1 Tax=unclassified Leifsonia TaxID=2663824 RepID=UPI000379804E|nr:MULTISPECIES: ABC transporter permease [unclassified Leifsonia]TDQ02853.1 ABC-2 type transport system permease protein [Leifsonia sp. 115AMFTsu3.1]
MSAQARFDALSRQKLAPVGAASPTGRRSIAALKEIFSHREMLALLVRRDLKSRYKDSALGFVWTLIRPLTQLFIYYIVIGKFLQAERGIPEFAVYVFTGLTAYGLLSEIIGGGTASIVGNAGLIKKVYLPREVFPLASVGSALFNFAIQLGILLIFSAIVGSFPWSPDFFYFFPALLVLLVYGTAFGLLLSALNVYLRDIQYLVEVLLLLLLWASPIVYSWGMVKGILGNGLALQIYTNNPITLAVLGFQKAFWMGGQGVAEYPAGLGLRLGIAFVIGLVLLVVFQRVFQRLQGNFAQAL